MSKLNLNFLLIGINLALLNRSYWNEDSGWFYFNLVILAVNIFAVITTIQEES